MEAVFKTKSAFTKHLHFDKNVSSPPQLKHFIQLSGLTIVGYRWKKNNCHLETALYWPTLFKTMFVSLCFSFHLLQILYRSIRLFGVILHQCSRNPSEARLPGPAITIVFMHWDPLSTEQTGLSKLLDCWHFANVISSVVQHWMMGQAWWSITREHSHVRKKRKKKKTNHLQQRLIREVGL